MKPTAWTFTITLLLTSFLLLTISVRADDEDEEEEETGAAATTQTILGRYQLTKSENFDEYMTALGVSWVLRQIANSVKPILELTKQDKTYTMKAIADFKTTSISFKLGEEFDEETLDGRKCKSKIILQGETKMIHTQLCDGKEYKIVREFTENEMTGTTKLGDIHVTRAYVKLGDEDKDNEDKDKEDKEDKDTKVLYDPPVIRRESKRQKQYSQLWSNLL